MKIEKIKGLENGSIIKTVSGRAVKIFDPKQPSEAQAKHGIHPQTIILQDNEGNELSVQLTVESQHLAGSNVGRIFHFQSMPSNDGKVDGLRVNRYTAKDGQERVSLQVTKHAHFYEVEETSEAPPISDLPLTTADKLPPAAVITKRHEVTVSSLVALYVNIACELELQMNGSKMLEKMLENPASSPVTTIFIQACQQGLAHKPILVTTNHPVVEPKVLDVHTMAKMIINDGYAATEDALKANGITWMDLYDEINGLLDVPEDKINSAWDMVAKSLAAAGESASQSAICRAICTDIENYKTLI